jgi:hypothetical protein
MSVDYTRKHHWKITPKGSSYRKTYIFSTQHIAKKSRREKQNQKDRYKYHLDKLLDREVRIEV